MADLGTEKNRASWAWENYRTFFPDYCRVAVQFADKNLERQETVTSTRVCSPENPCDAQAFMGTIADDWDPLGFALLDPKTRSPHACDLASSQEWTDQIESEQANFGARVFLIRNLSISDLDDATIRDFYDPEHDIVPGIGVQ